ncbi:MAG: GNAT family N-acetyltransferase [Bacteroidota bacterium]
MEDELLKEINSESEYEISYRILVEAGEDMFHNLGLKHWYPPISRTEYMAQLKGSKFFLYSVNDQIVATFALSTQDNSYPDPIWNNIDDAFVLSKLAVLPKYQHNRIGKKCLKAIEKYALENGKSRILLDAVAEHPFLQKFYEGNGFNLVSQKEIISKRGNICEIQLFENVLYE